MSTPFVNPNYNIPQGLLDDFQYDEVFTDEISEEDQDTFAQEQEDGTGGSDLLYPPQNFSVVQQDMHYATDGSLVVDIILEVDDMPNVTDYEIRVSKTGDAAGDTIII